MTFKHRMATALAALLIGAGFAGSAFAHGGMGGHRGGRMCEDRAARMAGIVAYAEKKLDITQAQRGAWTAFTREMENARKPMDQLCAEMTGEPPKEIDAALARRERMLAAGLQSLQSLRPAIAKLSEALTPEQREKLNGLIPGMGGGHRWGHR